MPYNDLKKILYYHIFNIYRTEKPYLSLYAER